jgi:murein DD-endopeptidase MepM/ murein hydrolase activator NlpD
MTCRIRTRLGAGTLALGCLGLTVAPSAEAAAAWRWPLAAPHVVCRGFDPPTTPWGAGHRGVDLRGRPGAPVRTAGPGVVGYAGPLAGRGVVTVHHRAGLETTYEPVTALVRPGQRVSAGTVLGRLDSGHGTCGDGSPALHWGLRRGATYLDPLQLVTPVALRLFPAWPAADPAVQPALPALDRPADPVNRRRPAHGTAAARSGAAVAAQAGLLASLGLAAVGGVRLSRRVRRPGSAVRS